MANFNPGEVVLAQTQSSAAKFDASQAVSASMPNKYQQLADMMSGTQYQPRQRSQPELGTEDFTSGVQAGLQNPLAYVTQKLPGQFQVPNFQPAPSSKAGSLPITLGKMYASMLPATGAEKLVSGGIGLAEKIPGAIKVAEKIPAWVSRVAQGTAGGAASAPSVDASPTTGAAFGLAGAAIPESVMGMIGKYLGKNVTPEQFEAARQAIPSNIKAPIGELSKSPGAQKLYSGSQSIAFSGADKPYNQLYNHLSEGVDSLTEGAPKTQTPNQDLYDEMTKEHSRLKRNTSDAYDDFAKYSDKNKKPFNRGAYDRYLDKNIDEFKKEFKESPTSEELDQKTLSALEKLKEDKIDNFSQAAARRKNITRVIEKNISDDKTYNDKLLLGAKDSLDESMRNSSSKDDKSLSKYLTAKNARIEQGKMEYLNNKERTPFYKIKVKNGAPENLINSYLKTGKNKDFSETLSNMTKYLSEDGKKILANAHINPTEDMTLAKKMKRISDLHPNQKDLLFGKKSPVANNLSKISNIYGGAKSANFTPKTGWTGSKKLQALTELMAALGVGSTVGVPHSAALGAAAAFPAAGRAAQMALRSNALKDAHMKYLQRSGKEALTKATPTGQAMRTALLALLGGNQNGA